VGALLAGGTLALGISAPWVSPFDPLAIVGPSLSPPSLQHLLGTDALGRDLWSGIVWGARASWLIGLTTALMTAAIGVLVGIASGLRGGRTDHVLMRVTEFFQALPRFFLVILVLAMFGAGMDRVVLVLALTSWTGLARVVRSEVMSLREHDFVAAARAAGATELQVAVGEILPNVLPVVTVLFGLTVGRVMLIEASLSFLGLGDPSVVSWGALAGQGQAFLRSAWWLATFPGAAIAASVLGLNLLGDALNERWATGE
jgi:peptide/nickel transport system permease protein